MFGKLNSFHTGLFYENFLLLQLNKVFPSENHALPGKKIHENGPNFGKFSLPNTQKFSLPNDSVYQTLLFQSFCKNNLTPQQMMRCTLGSV